MLWEETSRQDFYNVQTAIKRGTCLLVPPLPSALLIMSSHSLSCLLSSSVNINSYLVLLQIPDAVSMVLVSKMEFITEPFMYAAIEQVRLAWDHCCAVSCVRLCV